MKLPTTESLAPLTHRQRTAAVLDLGRRASADAAADAALGALRAGDGFSRHLAIVAESTRRDEASVLAALDDPSRRVRVEARNLVALVCSDAGCELALKTLWQTRNNQRLAVQLFNARRIAPVDAHLDWLAANDPGALADLVPLASPAARQRHLAAAVNRPSDRFWLRLERHAPGAMAEVFAAQLAACEGELPALFRFRLNHSLGALCAAVPDAALGLVETLAARAIYAPIDCFRVLLRRRPEATLAVIVAHRVADHLALAPLVGRAVHRLPADALLTLLRSCPQALTALGARWARLSAATQSAVARAWCDAPEALPWLGEEALKHLPPSEARDGAYHRWSQAARNADGVINLAQIAKLPTEYRQREARRHLDEVVALRAWPAQRIAFARFLPFDEAARALSEYTSNPLPELRAAALTALLHVPLYDVDTVNIAKALDLVVARQFEQDPIRGAMLSSLAAWPATHFGPGDSARLGLVLQHCLDAADLSAHTARFGEQLIVSRFAHDPSWSAAWLGRWIKARGYLHDQRLGATLDDAALATAGPVLLEVARAWGARDHARGLVALVDSLGARAARVEGLVALTESVRDAMPLYGMAVQLSTLLRRVDPLRFSAKLPALMKRWEARKMFDAVVGLAQSYPAQGELPDELGEAVAAVAAGNHRWDLIVSAVRALRRTSPRRFERSVEAILANDASTQMLPEVYLCLSRYRQDLLHRYVGATEPVQGRGATGKTRWILPFERGFARWNVADSEAYAGACRALIDDPEHDLPSKLLLTRRLAELTWTSGDKLTALASAADAAVREATVRALARMDALQGLTTLLECLGDARARFAIYGLRMALAELNPGRQLRVLTNVSLEKVTVAKEVVRLLGTVRDPDAYRALLELDRRKLHRDVRVALQRALWDHLDRPETWAIFERAVTAPDWVLAARLGDITADKLTPATDLRLSKLLAAVLDRPEVDARLDLLDRAGALAVRDPDGAFLEAVLRRLESPLDREVNAAARGLLLRAREHEAARVGPRMAALARDPRALTRALEVFCAFSLSQRHAWSVIAGVTLDALGPLPRWAHWRVKLAASALPAHQLGSWIEADADRAGPRPLWFDTVSKSLDRLPRDQYDALSARWATHRVLALRRLAFELLVRASATGDGWTPPRLALLAQLRRDPDPDLGALADGCFPPRENDPGWPSDRV
ncbi:MAG: hypothetical protein JNK72_01945 [Myxococcales bacterium]|nr:hypothetical protein [Myxococcales bacterium]